MSHQPGTDTSQSENTAAPLQLGKYIRLATNPSAHDLAQPTQPQDGRSSPVLRRDRRNRILIFNGCFNPPHRGHLAHLKHAFHHSGEDLNIVGAIVLVAGDHYLRWKYGTQSNALLLSEAQRVRLWKAELAQAGAKAEVVGEDAEAAPANWCWVLSETLWFRDGQNLERLFRRDKLDVEFARLAGGDKVSIAAVEHRTWGCPITITTDISRPVDFYCSDDSDVPTHPEALNNHGPWRQMITASHQDKRAVWVCESQTRGGTVRFVASYPHERVDPKLSSTMVREIVAAARNQPLSVGQLESKLQGVTLSPGLLAQFIQDANGETTRLRQTHGYR